MPPSSQRDAAAAGDRGDRAAARARQSVRRGHHEAGGQRVGEPTPVSAVAAFGLVSVNVSVVVPFTAMLAAPNALAIVGGALTPSNAGPDNPLS